MQVFNLDTKQKVQAFAMPELVAFWKWLTPTQLGLVTASAVFHWSTEVRPASRAPGTCSPQGSGSRHAPPRRRERTARLCARAAYTSLVAAHDHGARDCGCATRTAVVLSGL